MGIPKTIHYCWFGGKTLPEKVKNCIKSWEKYCPDYKIIEWNENNYDVCKIPYMKEAYEMQKWAFVSDYARMDVVYNYGGIYLDTDVELIRNLDDLLMEKAFFAIEKSSCKIATGLGFGAEQNNPTLYKMMKEYHNVHFIMDNGKLNLIPCPKYSTDLMVKLGFFEEDRTQKIDEALVLSSEYFCPMDFRSGNITLTEKTYGIHWFEASWHTDEDRHIHEREMKIRQKFPNKPGNLICFVYRKSYRFLEYMKKGILIAKIKEKIKY